MAVALGTVYIVWGSTYLAIRVAVETIPPMIQTGARFLLASALIAAWLVARNGPRIFAVPRRELAHASFVGVVLLVGGTGIVGIAEQDVPSGLTALIIASIPLIVVIIRALAGDVAPVRTLASVVIGFGAIAALMLPGQRVDDTPLGPMLLVVVAAALWAVGSYWSGKAAMPGHPLVSTTVQMTAAGVVCVLLALVRNEHDAFAVAAISPESAIALAYLVLAGSVAAFTAYAWLLRHVPLSTVSTYAFVNPVVALVLGWALLGETITTLMLASAGVIVLSVAITVRTEGSRHDSATDELAAPAAAAAPAPAPAPARAEPR